MDPVAEYFEQSAKSWVDDAYTTALGVKAIGDVRQEIAIQQIKTHIKSQKIHICDLGCGDGSFTRSCVKRRIYCNWNRQI